LEETDQTIPTQAVAPLPPRQNRRTLIRLGLSLLRLALHLLSFGLTLSLAAVSLSLGGVAALLWVSGRDVTLGPETLPVWPKGLVAIDLLHAYAWAYLAGGLGMLLIGLPLALAVAEKAVLAMRLPPSPNRPVPLKP